VRYERACIPVGGLWSTPFARLQEAAADRYRVVIDDDGAVDADATAARRSAGAG